MDSPSPVARPSDSGSRSALIWGFVLILIGGGALASQLWPDVDRYIPLVIGLGLLVVFAISRSYLALVGGGVLTGLGIGLLVSSFFTGPNADGPGATLGLGLGFISVWVVSWLMSLKEHHFWPLIPGGILTLVGVGLIFDLYNDQIADYLLPAVVLVIGALLMVVGYLRLNRDKGGTTS